MSEEFLGNKGNYRDLRCFQMAEHLYDITFVFCERFISGGDRTKDQMIQAARSIKQNIAEGSSAAYMSTQTEMFLTNVGKSSQQELLLDFEDYLTTRGLEKWSLDDQRLKNVREALKGKMPREFMIQKAKGWSDETLANVAITMVHQCDRMLSGLLAYQKRQFLQNGGVKEQMTKARIEYRNSQKAQNQINSQSTQSSQNQINSQRSQSPQSSQSSQNNQYCQSALDVPNCPKCGRPMCKRIQRKGNMPGREFWGCSDFPRCNGTRQMNQSFQSPQSSRSPQSSQKNQYYQSSRSSQSSQKNQYYQSSQSPQSSQSSRKNQDA